MNQADNASHGFHYVALQPSVQAAATWARVNTIEPSPVSTYLDPNLNSSTDVVVRNQDYTTYCWYSWHSAGSTIGVTTCDTLVG